MSLGYVRYVGVVVSPVAGEEGVVHVILEGLDRMKRGWGVAQTEVVTSKGV